MNKPLFRLGDFALSSGACSFWKIDADALSPADWEALAAVAASLLPPYGTVEGVPTGGLAFAAALRDRAAPGSTALLIAEDVVTTGASMERHRAGRDALGVAAFCRGACPAWVVPLFRLYAPVAPQEENATDGECHLCGGMTDSLAGDPGRWPLRFATHDYTGVCRFWHVDCVVGRMSEASPSWDASGQMEAENARLRSALARALGALRTRPNAPEALRAAAAILEEANQP